MTGAEPWCAGEPSKTLPLPGARDSAIAGRLHRSQPGFNGEAENLPGGEPCCCNGFVQFRLRGVVQGKEEFFVGIRIHPQILPE